MNQKFGIILYYIMSVNTPWNTLDPALEKAQKIGRQGKMYRLNIHMSLDFERHSLEPLEIFLNLF